MAHLEINRRTLSLTLAGFAWVGLLLIAWLLADRLGWFSAALFGMLIVMVAQRADLSERNARGMVDLKDHVDLTTLQERPPERSHALDFMSVTAATRAIGFAIAAVSAVMFVRQYF
jgi:hypothetical protein